MCLYWGEDLFESVICLNDALDQRGGLVGDSYLGVLL